MATADTNEHVHCGTKSLQPTPDNTKDIAEAGLWRGIVGNGATAVSVAVNLVDDTDSNVLILLLQPGCQLSISIRRVRATGTSALPGEFFLVR